MARYLRRRRDGDRRHGGAQATPDEEAGPDPARTALDGLTVVDQLLRHSDVGEIMINGPGPIWVEVGGGLQPSGHRIDDYGIELLIERVLQPLGLRADRTSPVADARLVDGSRVHVVVPPLAIDGPVVTIRKFPDRPVPLSAFGSPDMVAAIESLMADRHTVLVVGPTSSGKTTLLNAMSALIDPLERVICIEDTAELRLAGAGVVRLEARPANSEGVGAVGLGDLVRAALRMRPDRLVVGEVRGPEAFDLVLALSAGHRGSMATCHAAGPGAGLSRLAALAGLAGLDVGHELLQQHVIDAVDSVIHVDRVGARRFVRSISAVASRPGEPVLRPIWPPSPQSGSDFGSGSGPGSDSGPGSGPTIGLAA